MSEEWSRLLRRVQDRVAVQPKGYPGSAVDELIEERRAEAVREDASPNATVADPMVGDSGSGVA